MRIAICAAVICLLSVMTTDAGATCGLDCPNNVTFVDEQCEPVDATSLPGDGVRFTAVCEFCCGSDTGPETPNFDCMQASSLNIANAVNMDLPGVVRVLEDGTTEPVEVNVVEAQPECPGQAAAQVEGTLPAGTYRLGGGCVMRVHGRVCCR